MPALRILFAAVAAVVAYAAAQDQVSVRVCPEYFTVGHDSSGLPFDDPTLLGLYWGVQGGLGGGIVLGVALALTCRFGDGPKLALADVAPGLAVLVGAIALASLGAMAGTCHVGGATGVRFDGVLGGRLPPESHVPFLAVTVAHFTTYLVSAAGSVALCVWAGLRRRASSR